MDITVTLTDAELAQVKASNLVVIIGMPAAGKTTVAQWIHTNVLPGHSLYHTDDYIDYGYQESLYALMKDMSYDTNPKKMIEGVQAYRFLRKTIERDIVVDCIIDVRADANTRLARYMGRGKGNLPATFEKNLATVLKDYTDALAKLSKRPHIITIFT